MDTEVLVVGAGPVGLTLAIDLGLRGVKCVLIEQQEEPQFLPKMERCNARTMEVYRRLGLAERIRAAGLQSHVPMDVYVVLALDEPPLLRLPYPSVDGARTTIRTTNDGTQPLEPYQLISQYTLEPLLKAVAETLPSVTVLYGTEFLALAQEESAVTAEVKSRRAVRTIRASYLVGCDGGASPVRKQLGISLRGEGNILQLRQALFRCDELYDKIPIDGGPGKGRHYHVADGQQTFLIMQDSTRHWTLHSVVARDEDMKAVFETTVGVPIRYEMLHCAEWKQNLLLADSYGKGRAFLAGDAVHLMPPPGGLGMNTGVGDAIDLSWKLAATLKGWGGPGLLASYEVERRLIGDRNLAACRYASLGRRKWRAQFRPNIRDDTPEGLATRDNLARVAAVEQRRSNEMIGAELGYRYVASPIVWEEPGGPEHSFREYHPTTWPGARLPHVWLDDGTPMQDRIPYEGYTLLRLGRSKANASGIERAFRSLGAPVSVLDVPDDGARQVYGCDLLLLRPDLHVVWRGDRPHQAPEHLAAVATGHQRLLD